jgi:hypothetical protein
MGNKGAVSVIETEAPWQNSRFIVTSFRDDNDRVLNTSLTTDK